MKMNSLPPFQIMKFSDNFRPEQMMQQKLFSRSLSVIGRRAFSNEAYIVAATRTPVASFQKSLASVSVTALGSTVLKDILTRSSIDPALIDEVFMGHGI